MDATNPFWTYWYFHLPNYLLAALAYTMLARFGLSLVVPADWPNYIWRFFLRVTDPILAVTAAITPRFVRDVLMPLVAVFWLLLLRMVLWFALRQLGLAPGVSL